MLLYDIEGTVVHVYVYEGDPCIWMASSPLIWPKEGMAMFIFAFGRMVWVIVKSNLLVFLFYPIRVKYPPMR